MTKREKFIEIIDGLIENGLELDEDAAKYYESIKNVKEVEKPKFTDNGKMILQHMIESKAEYNNLFKSKDIGENIGLTSRTVSGGMRKLVTDGYVEKVSTNPVVYSLTAKGEAETFED